MLHLVAAATFPLACTPGTPQESIQEFIEQNLSVEQFRSYLASSDRTVFIAELGSTPAGYAMLKFDHAIDPEVSAFLGNAPAAELNKFYLLAGRHGTGLADQLMLAAIEEARQRGAASIWLGVNVKNARANSFYDKHAFTRKGIKKFKVGAQLEDDLIREHVL